MRIFPWLLIAGQLLSNTLGIFVGELLSVSIPVERVLDTRRVMGLILVLPLLETVFLQLVVIEPVYRILGRSTVGLVSGVVLSGVAFFFAHLLQNGLFNAIAYGAVGSITLGLMYALERKHGVKRAFVVTWLLHAAGNTMLVASLAMFNQVVAKG